MYAYSTTATDSYQPPVTGSARETSTDGYTYASAENVELDPQGRDVGASDPYAVEDEIGPADYSGTYEIAGNGFDSGGHGCEWDGMPVRCEVLGFVGRTRQVVGLGVRSQGSEAAGFALGVQFRAWRFDVYRRENVAGGPEEM